MKNFFITLFIFLSVSSAHAVDKVRWDELSLSYLSLNADVDQTGFALYGSKLVGRNIYLFGAHSTATGDIDGFDSKSTNFSLGLGYRFAISEKTDYYGQISLEALRLEVSAEFMGFSSDIDSNEAGIGFEVGVRSLRTEKIELQAALGHIAVRDSSKTAIGGGMTYHFADNFSASANVAVSSDENSTSLGIIWFY